jgi:hypothetical protein
MSFSCIAYAAGNIIDEAASLPDKLRVLFIAGVNLLGSATLGLYVFS